MSRGKDICKELKAVRRRIAEENGIPLEIPECSYKGECSGTCPRCEAEVQYLEAELEKRLRLGKVATVAGITLGLAACGHSGTTNQDTNDVREGEEVTALCEEDSNDVPPPPEEELPDWFVPELEGIVSQDDGYRMVPTKDTMERLKDVAIDWEHLYNFPSECNSWENTMYSSNPFGESAPVIRRGESGMVVRATGHVRGITKVLVPMAPNETRAEAEKRNAYRDLPPVVEYEETDGVKVVKQQNPTEQ